MKKKLKKLFDVSDGNYTPRLILFILVLAFAVAAFTFGVTRIGHKETGLYTVEYLEEGEEAVLYRSGVTLKYYFSGSSAEIRTDMNALKSLYSSTLSRAYRTLDPENLYTGYQNLAYLSQHPGETVEISDELYAVLKDALEKTGEGDGFNLFSGAYRKIWSEITVLYDAAEFDPAANSDSAERLQKTFDLVNNPDNFSLELADDGKKTACLKLSDEYKEARDRLELADCVLDLGLLHDAYMLRILRDALQEGGWGNGYIQTESGLSIALSSWNKGEYLFYGFPEGEAEVFGSLPVTPQSVYSMLQVFSMNGEEEVGYYAIQENDAGPVLYRNPWYNPLEGPAFVSTAFGYSEDGDIVAAAYDCMKLFTAESSEALDQRLTKSGAALSGAAVFGEEGAADAAHSGRTVYLSEGKTELFTADEKAELNIVK